MNICIVNKSSNPTPEYKTDGSAGFDIAAAETVKIYPGDIKLVSTGLFFEIPVGFELQIRPRSGLATRGVTVFNSPGTVDSDYRGEVGVILNYIADFDRSTITINEGDRIAQGIIAPYVKADFNLVEELSDTERGKQGFGSTGL